MPQVPIVDVPRDGPDFALDVDGLVAGSVPTQSGVNLDAPGRHGFIGAHGYGGNQFQFEGDIAAMVAVRGPLADGDLALLEQYLRMKYVIAEGSPPGP